MNITTTTTTTVATTTTTQQPQSLPCFLVNNLTTSTYEQCKFVIDNDCLEEDSLVDYVYLIYCDFGQEFRYLAIALVVFLVVFLFLGLSSVADEFLCPSLLTVAKNLRMSDSLAGVTLLAFGNGCPDIFSSLAAASDDRPELIVGELLGAGIFCTSIVSGLIFINSDFKIACRPILRDTTFYMLAVYLIWYYCWSQEITFYGSLAFIIIYVIYLIVALGGQAIYSRMQGDYAIADKQAENENEVDGDKNGQWFKWREESFKRRHMAQMMKKLETTPLASDIQVQYNDGVTCIHLGSDSMSSASPPATVAGRLEVQLSSSIRSNDVGHINKAYVDENNSQRIAMRLEKKFDSLESLKSTSIRQQQVIKLEAIKQQQPPVIVKCDDVLSPREWDDFLAHINPLGSVEWSETNYLTKFLMLLRAPILIAALITVPVVDHDKRLSNWCRPLNALHCITVPLSVFMVITRFEPNENLTLLGIPLPVFVLIPSAITALFVFKTTAPHEAPKYLPVFAYFGFAMSIMWIYMLATEIISLLKTVGIMFSMTDTAIGLGILAWGNSLGDIVANTSLAKAGYPQMAIGATIGAPLLNLLLGFGLAFTISLKPGEISVVEYSPTITLLCSTLATILISLMLTTLVPPEKSKKPFGYMLILSYGFYFALAICLEYEIIKF